MKKIILIFVASVFVFILSLSKVYATSVNQIYWGAWIDYGNGTAPWDTTVWDTFEQHTGKKISILHFGQAWQDGSGNYQPFRPILMDTIRNRGAYPLVDWGSWKLGYGRYQPDFKLSAITQGNYDTYIHQWATDAKAWGHPFFLRFDWEMNIGGQFPWNFVDSDLGNSAGDYIAMWQHVRQIFVSVGAANVTWVWCPNIYFLSGSNAKPFMQAYPGDSFVDWVALDGYNFGTNWDSFSNIFSDSYKVLQGKVTGITGAPTKPIMLGEWASNEAGDNGNRKASWITDTLGTQLPNNFPAIKAVVWFNWNQGSYQWIIESTTLSQNAFASAIASNYYAANDFANASLSPIPPLLNSIDIFNLRQLLSFFTSIFDYNLIVGNFGK